MSAVAKREPPHPRSTPPHSATEPVQRPASEVVAAVVSAEERLAGITPEWRLVLKRRPGSSSTKPVDYPQAALMKGGGRALLNDHAVRMLAGLGGSVPPPAQLLVRVFVDGKNRLVGFSRAEKGDDQAFVLTKEKKRAAPAWTIGLRRAIEDGAPDKRIFRRVRAFGNRVFGFHFGPEET